MAQLTRMAHGRGLVPEMGIGNVVMNSGGEGGERKKKANRVRVPRGTILVEMAFAIGNF